MKPENAAKIKYGVWGLICGAVIAMIIDRRVCDAPNQMTTLAPFFRHTGIAFFPEPSGCCDRQRHPDTIRSDVCVIRNNA